MQLGRWPYEAGWLQHSNKFVEAMQVIDTEVKKVEASVGKKEGK
jgi:hypothetical protein